MPTDMDGVVEINRRFLAIETKQTGAGIPEGQHRFFDALVTDRRWTVVVVWGKPQEPVALRLWPGEVIPATLATFQDVCSAWGMWAHLNSGTPFAWTPSPPINIEDFRIKPCQPGCSCALCREWPTR